jgi:uncharacterized membrane protein YjjB (DUF3815 family)
MHPVLQFFTSYLSVAAVAVTFNCPRKALPLAALTGAVGWSVYYCMLNPLSMTSVASRIVAAAAIALCAEILARAFHNPVTAYVIPGIIPLVPGFGVYDTMMNFLQGNTAGAVNSLVGTVLDAAAIAVGLLLVSGLSRIIKQVRTGAFR